MKTISKFWAPVAAHPSQAMPQEYAQHPPQHPHYSHQPGADSRGASAGAWGF